jgi:hypothetical protein
VVIMLLWALGLFSWLPPLKVAAASWLAPTVISSGIAGAVALATHYSSQSAKKHESREDIRTEAFDQAKAFYIDVIDRQDREVEALRIQVREALRRASDAETSADAARSAVRKMARDLADRDAMIADLTAP